MVLGMSEDRALEAARRARRALRRGETRDAAWLALWSTELDPDGGTGLAVLARILYEVSGDALATIGTREAIRRGLPPAEQREVERFHRIDLWSRGLLRHEANQSLLPAAAFEDGRAFTPTENHDLWFEERAERWGTVARECEALRRLVGALSDAWEMPQDVADPLRAQTPWTNMPAYTMWKARDPLAQEEAEYEDDEDTEPALFGVTVVSDYWTEETIARLETGGRIGEATEIAEHWVELRPGRMAPRMTLMRLYEAMGQTSELESLEQDVLASETEDLNELEEARVGLGLLRRFDAQMEILDRMDRLAPGHPVILANRGAVALELNRPEQAEADLQLALQLDPESGPALTNLALLRMRESDYVAARGLLEQAKLLHPDEAQVRYYLAACLHNQHHPDASLREARAAVDLDPSFAPAQMLLSQLEGRTTASSSSSRGT